MKIFLLLPTSIDLNHILMTLAQVIVELVTAGEASGLELTAWDRAEEAAACTVGRRGVALAISLASECYTTHSACG